jgi:hypothetical protein
MPQIRFMKNLAIMGGMRYLVEVRPGGAQRGHESVMVPKKRRGMSRVLFYAMGMRLSPVP